jgi:hypothetical protein
VEARGDEEPSESSSTSITDTDTNATPQQTASTQFDIDDGSGNYTIAGTSTTLIHATARNKLRLQYI